VCRFNSGFFFHQKALQKYDWYWRVEPDIEMYCDIDYDPFTFMRENNKTYGFVISMYEFLSTVPTLWGHTKDFVASNPQHLAEDNSLNWIVDGANVSKAFEEKNVEGDYNLCHFWSNFEIADMNFFRSTAYQQYFSYLDSMGGFFYERWGDAPVHSLALSLFLPRKKIHHFADFGEGGGHSKLFSGYQADLRKKKNRIQPRASCEMSTGRREPLQWTLLLPQVEQL